MGLLLAMIFYTPFFTHAAPPDERSITIMNDSGRRADIHWVNPDTGEMVLQSNPDVLNGASMDLNSYVGHTFQVRELPGKKTGVCAGEGEVCRVDHFTVNTNADQGELFVTCVHRTVCFNGSILLIMLFVLEHHYFFSMY